MTKTKTTETKTTEIKTDLSKPGIGAGTGTGAAVGTRGGAGRGQGRKPVDPAFRRSKQIAVKCTEAEYEALAEKADRDEDDLSTWVRSAALAASCALAALLGASTLTACGGDTDPGDPSDQPTDIGGEPVAQPQPAGCVPLKGSWWLDLTLQSTARGRCPAQFTAAVFYDDTAVRSADKCTATITTADEDGGMITFVIEQLDRIALKASVVADMRDVDGTPDCRGTYTGTFSLGL